MDGSVDDEADDAEEDFFFLFFLPSPFPMNKIGPSRRKDNAEALTILVGCDVCTTIIWLTVVWKLFADGRRTNEEPYKIPSAILKDRLCEAHSSSARKQSIQSLRILRLCILHFLIFMTVNIVFRTS